MTAKFLVPKVRSHEECFLCRTFNYNITYGFHNYCFKIIGYKITSKAANCSCDCDLFGATLHHVCVAQVDGHVQEPINFNLQCVTFILFYF
jgi:hypothetical protein